SATLQGTATVAPTARASDLTDLRIDASGAKTLRAAATLTSGATTVDSSSFTVAADAASQLVYTTQPAGATAGSAFTTQPIVKIEDQFGNVVTSGADSTRNVT